MNTRKILMIASLTTLFTLGSAGVAMAYGGHPGKGHGMNDSSRCSERGGMRGMKRIEGLSDEQQSQLKAIAESRREQTQTQRRQMQESRQALHQAISQGATAVELDILAGQQAELFKQQILGRAEQRQQMMAVLNEEQRAQMQQRHTQRMERMGKQRAN